VKNSHASFTFGWTACTPSPVVMHRGSPVTVMIGLTTLLPQTDRHGDDRRRDATRRVLATSA
jgi:hypothetical protein